MPTEEQKMAERQRDRREYFAFLDRRIPELHAEGKARGKGAVVDPGASKYPGVEARRQADAEWGARKRAEAAS